MGKECKATCASRCLADARAFDRALVVCAAGHTSHACDCGAALVAKVEAATADMARAAGVTFGGSSPEPVASETPEGGGADEPPFDGSPPCPFCPMPVRNLLAVAHNLTVGSRDTTIDDLRRAVEMCKPLADAHFANSMHSHGTIRRNGK